MAMAAVAARPAKITASRAGLPSDAGAGRPTVAERIRGAGRAHASATAARIRAATGMTVISHVQLTSAPNTNAATPAVAAAATVRVSGSARVAARTPAARITP